MHNDRDKRRAHDTLRRLWREWSANYTFPSVDWTDSVLRELVSELIDWESTVAGCVSQVVEQGMPDSRCLPILRINEELSAQIAQIPGEDAEAVLLYKIQFDKVVSAAVRVIEFYSSQHKSEDIETA